MSSYVVIGIHGLNNKPPEAQLKDWWIKAILEGIGRNLNRSIDTIEFDLVYWADLMYSTPLDPDPAPYTQAAGTGPLPRHTGSFLGQLKDLGKEGLGGALDKGTALPGGNIVIDEVLEHKAPDLDRYYGDPEKRLQIRQRLSHKLQTAHSDSRHIMLIAHSMGSIVAFDVLSILGHTTTGFRVHHFVTVGSPLGLHEVKQKIRGEGHVLKVPNVIERWTNFADRKDLVAIDTRLHTDYRTNDQGVGVVDKPVFNGYLSPSGRSSHHKIYGYLRTPEISETIHEFISPVVL